jgi:hypothetical protein
MEEDAKGCWLASYMSELNPRHIYEHPKETVDATEEQSKVVMAELPAV